MFAARTLETAFGVGTRVKIVWLGLVLHLVTVQTSSAIRDQTFIRQNK